MRTGYLCGSNSGGCVRGEPSASDAGPCGEGELLAVGRLVDAWMMAV